MHSVVLFCEDSGHEIFIKALIKRLAREQGTEVEVHALSVRGGHGKAIYELKQYVKELLDGRNTIPHLLVVAIDGNCYGHLRRRQEIAKAVPDAYHNMLVCAVPDPHIERWFLIDSAAFKTVLGRGCSAPIQKCDRDFYKGLLAEEVRDSGFIPLLGGLEHAESLVENLHWNTVEKEPSLKRFIRDIKSHFRQWARS